MEGGLIEVQLTSPSPLSPDAFLVTGMRPGDRLGLFPRTMSAVVV